jgi:D-3-phosphoglycerate dehydrogenase
VIATPHIAASTEEAQELVGLETAATVRDFLRDGLVRNAVNFPSIHTDELQRLQPWIRLADRLGSTATQIAAARIDGIGVRYYGALAESHATEIVATSAVAGMLRPILSSGVSMVNARTVARSRGIDIIESRSLRPRHYTSLVSVKLHTDAGEQWVEGTVFEPGGLRLVSMRGVAVEAPLAGTILIVANEDRPGVIGDVGTILGRHGVNIANFALGRGEAGAIGVVNVDEAQGDRDALGQAVDEIRRAPAVREAWIVRLG